MKRGAALVAFALLAGCAEVTLPDPVRLPRDTVEGAGDPTRAAVSRAAYVFADPARVAGEPAAMARAIADMEFLAAALPFDPRYQQRDPLLPWQLAQGRAEWRAALGIPAGQPAQPLIDGLYALARTPGAAPPPPLPPDVAARLADMPPLPETGRAAAAAQRAEFEAQFPVRRFRW